MRDTALLLACSAILVACGGAPATTRSTVPPAPPPSRTDDAPLDPDAGRAPTPYTAAQIRSASKAGRTYEFLIERPGELPIRNRVVFVIVTEDRATIASQLIDPHGEKIGEPELTETTWDELRRHGSFAIEATTITDDQTETPVGSFDCKRYVVVEQGPAGEQRRIFWFANDLPGAPVEAHLEQGGEVVSRTTLLRYEPGE
jgi:hypothetical protein